MKIALIIGTRPQIIKASAIIQEAQKRGIDLQIIQTGQHYDYEMTQIFLEEFEMSTDYVNLSVGSGSYCWQIATMMMKLEKTLAKQKIDFALVLGDTNSTLAGALSSSLLKIPLGHVEAGARSYDMTMPEEVNRRLVDHVSSLLFAATQNCVENLLKENIPKDSIYLVSDVMYDVLLNNMKRIEQNKILTDLNLEGKDYVVLTMHRPHNLIDKKFKSLINSIKKSKLLTVFPVHPRTKKELRKAKLTFPKNLVSVQPLGYHEMLKLVSKAKLVMTDSGGLQKEAFWLKIPCLTLRPNTEWTETIELGTNELIGEDFDGLASKMKQCSNRNFDIRSEVNPFGDGKASKRIIEVISSHA
jgi:UDP-N-acetylglucosamine 2-epimerase (non-hydrolysing)